MEKRLSGQLSDEIGIAGTILRQNPELLTTLSRGITFREIKPAQMLNALQQKIQTDFPPLTDVTFELRTVHDSMKEYLSPAFYLTPPMDTGTPNVIYINPAAGYQAWSFLPHWHMKDSRGIFTRLSPSNAKNPPTSEIFSAPPALQKDGPPTSNPMPTSTPPIIFRILLPQSLLGSPG